MADYRELLRRAISALPENNGAARRAVYEKARAALVAQLRAITPALPAREITQHRLQLEDCIRQVEHEASEAVITLGRDSPPPPQPFTPKPPDPADDGAGKEADETDNVPDTPDVPSGSAPDIPAPPIEAEPDLAPASEPEAKKPEEQSAAPELPEETAPAPKTSIEDIISLAASVSDADVEMVIPAPAPPPEPHGALSFGGLTQRSGTSTPLKSPVFAPRREPAPAANTAFGATPPSARIEPGMSGAALARKPNIETIPIAEVVPVEPALSTIREVEVEPDGTREAEGAIERAIETLDREARGEATEQFDDPSFRKEPAGEPIDEAAFGPVDPAPRSGTGLTIFLVVFALLLTGVGGAGFWAWNEGFLPLDQMFGRAQPAVVAPAQNNGSTPSMDAPAAPDASASAPDTPGPGNTATATTSEPTSALEGMEIEDRLEPSPEPVTPTGRETVLPSLNNSEVKTEERLSSEDTSIAADDPAASVDPAVLAGSQSLLLEASPNGRSGAVPFSGTVEWTEGVDEIGLPTLIAEASIPARNLGVSVTIRKNSDPVLPASHLMEVNFDVSDTFIGGSITSLPGVLLKDEELVPGAPLVGASARIIGNSFLFALSASPADAATNTSLLETRRWMDLAVVYGTGRNAILTLEKDDEAQALFGKVFEAWK